MGTTQARHVYITLRTGSGSSLTLTPIAGDPSWDGFLMEGQQEPQPVMSRGTCIEHIDGDEQGVSWSQEIYDGDIVDGTADDLVNMAQHTGAYAADITACPGGVTWMLAINLTILDPGRGPRQLVGARTTLKCTFAPGAPSKWTLSGTAWGISRA